MWGESCSPGGARTVARSPSNQRVSEGRTGREPRATTTLPGILMGTPPREKVARASRELPRALAGSCPCLAHPQTGAPRSAGEGRGSCRGMGRVPALPSPPAGGPAGWGARARRTGSSCGPWGPWRGAARRGSGARCGLGVRRGRAREEEAAAWGAAGSGVRSDKNTARRERANERAQGAGTGSRAAPRFRGLRSGRASLCLAGVTPQTPSSQTPSPPAFPRAPSPLAPSLALPAPPRPGAPLAPVPGSPARPPSAWDWRPGARWEGSAGSGQ